jgi:hypothetical protein
MTDLAFGESISYTDWQGDVGPTPADSTKMLSKARSPRISLATSRTIFADPWAVRLKRDTLTLVLGVLCAYKDLGSHRGLVSC